MLWRMSLTRRVTIAAIGAGLTLAAFAVNPGRAAAPAAPVMHSGVFTWESLSVEATKVGARRAVFDNPTPTLERLEMHVTTLRPGESPHGPHRHPNEELIIIKEGTLESFVNGEYRRVGPGSIVFQASNQLHGIRNVGNGPATYHVIQWQSPGMLKK